MGIVIFIFFNNKFIAVYKMKNIDKETTLIIEQKLLDMEFKKT